MWIAIAQIMGGIGALAGLLTVLYKYYWSPQAKQRRKKEAEWQESNKTGDPGGLI